MTTQSFEDFKNHSIGQYASDLARVEEISVEEAHTYASLQFQKLVPDGIATIDQIFLDAFDAQTDKPIGYLWLGFQTRFGRRIASINDICINESHRGQGFGKILMSLAEQEARKQNATRVRLHVFNDNEIAKGLYLSMGFAPTSLDMRKDL
jgi:ribosomal protein S18 acetylase RimI-like enzyme